MKFSIKEKYWRTPYTYTGEILNRKLHFYAVLAGVLTTLPEYATSFYDTHTQNNNERKIYFKN